MEEDLNEDVRLEIFSHLPPEPILKCKLVCKSWENLLSHKKVGLLFLIGEYGKRNLELYYGDYDEIFGKASSAPEEFSYGSLTKINHPVINQRRKHLWVDQIVNSCNGLVCLKVPHHGINDPVYIFNPATTEYINLPRLKRRSGYVISGFGYHPLSNEYKVVRIHYPNRLYDFVPNPKGFVEIYTLGRNTEGWRSIGEVSYLLCKRGVLANGSLYWLDYEQNKILAFNLANEEFRWLPSMPQCFSGSTKTPRYLIKVLGGDLCLVHSDVDHPMDIWSYKFKEKKTEEEDYQPWGWILEIRIPSSVNTKAVFLEPFALTRDNGVLLWNETGLFCYDTKAGNLKKIVDESWHEFSTFQGVPHMNSLLSMKSLGGKLRTRKVQHKEKKMPKTSKIIIDD